VRGQQNTAELFQLTRLLVHPLVPHPEAITFGGRTPMNITPSPASSLKKAATSDSA